MRKYIRASLAILPLALLTPAIAVAQQHFPATEDLEVMLRYLVEDQETPGIVLGILEADGSTRIVSYGSAGPDARPLGPRSVFELGSITKVFTGILLVDMVDRGEVSLSDPVSMYLPEGVAMPSRNGREITLLDLATHRSALTRMPSNMPMDPENPYPEYTVEDMYAFLSEHELRREIGSEFEYSNIAVALLGEVLARAAGGSYEEVVRARILDPLGMDMTSTIVAGELREWNTQGYDDGEVAPYRNWPNLPAMGALRSTAEDMLTFLAANVGEPATRLENVMRDAHEVRASVNPRAGIGLLWQTRQLGDRAVVMHGGSTAGYSTRIGFDPELGVGFVLLTNTNGFGDDIDLDFLRRGPPLGISEIAVPPEVLQTYAGAYEMPSGETLFVRLEDEGYLTLQIPQNVRFRMHAESDTRFYLRRTPWRIDFTHDDAGQVAGIVVDMEGTERRGRKVSVEMLPSAVVAGNAALDRPLAVEDMDRYAGAYTLRSGERSMSLRVFVDDDRLMGQPEGQRPSVLLYQGDHEFVPAAEIDSRVVFTVENGRAEGVTVHMNGAALPGTRLQQDD